MAQKSKGQKVHFRIVDRVLRQYDIIKLERRCKMVKKSSQKLTLDDTGLPHFYSVRQVAKALALHPRTIERKIRAGEIKAVRFGKGWRIEKSELDRYIAKSKKNS